MKMKFSIVATGDSLLTQRLPQQDKSCLAFKEFFEQADGKGRIRIE